MDTLKQDIRLTLRSFDRLTSDRQYVDIIPGPNGDIATVSGRENLAQALINRLLTRKGDLTRLGHPDYGSRLHSLIGELNNTRFRGKAEIFIRECLAREKRIAEIVIITFSEPNRHDTREMIQAQVIVKPIPTPDQSDRNITLILPLNQIG
jgi:phage baseplate assembly protein W